MLPALASLIALQQLDTAADAARKRLTDLPAAAEAIDQRLEAASTAVEVAEAALAENHHARRELEKEVAAVDARLSRFEDHRAAVKTNQEYTALLHEIATAKSEKDAIEERILLLLESDDDLTAGVADAQGALAQARADATVERAALVAEGRDLEAELLRLAADRQREAAGIDKAVLARYDQLLKQRKMIAVAEMRGEVCMACHVRQRPAVVQHVRRNSEIVPCESCQRILYFTPSPAAEAAVAPSSA
jgi:uncharacterized protein